MTVIVCPTCGSDLIEPEKNDLYCIKCGDLFEIGNAKHKEVAMDKLYERLQEIKYISNTRRNGK